MIDFPDNAVGLYCGGSKPNNGLVEPDTVKSAQSDAIPLTSRQFDRWLIKQDKTVWPDRLLETVERARLALQGTEQGVGQDPGIQAVARRDLYAFTRAHAEWKR